MRVRKVNYLRVLGTRKWESSPKYRIISNSFKTGGLGRGEKRKIGKRILIGQLEEKKREREKSRSPPQPNSLLPATSVRATKGLSMYYHTPSCPCLSYIVTHLTCPPAVLWYNGGVVGL